MMKRSPTLNFLVATAALLAATLLPAQTASNPESMDPGAFYGFWKFQEPAGDTCIVIIKRGGRLSCFWAGSATRAIEKGEWERTGETLTANWQAGHVDVYKMLGDNAIERSTFNSGQSLLGAPALTIRGVRVDSRIPGSLTVQEDGPPPEREAPETEVTPRPSIPVNSPFVGYWKVDQSTGLLGIGGGEPYFYLKLSRNGEATVALRDWEGDQGVRGDWSIQDNRAVIRWPNNRRDVLLEGKNDGFVLGYYRPKDELTRSMRNPVEAIKVDANEAERYFEAGDFKRLTVVDIRGRWIPKDATGMSEYISIEGWGNAYRYPARDGGGGTDPGKWRLGNDSIHITWIDGSKDLIRLSFPDFIQDSFAPGSEFTDTPEKSVTVIRTQAEN